MKNSIIAVISLLLLILSIDSRGQEENLEVQGAIQISDSRDSTPDPGTIRWNGSDFLGWNGTKWISLTSMIAYDGTVTDIDGNVYMTVKIHKEWMAENLRTTKYRDGTDIYHYTDTSDWSNAFIGAWCWLDNDSIYEKPYGKLYNWNAVIDPRGLCPDGWRVPSETDWTNLWTLLGGLNVAGGKMKEDGHIHWESPNAMYASNDSGFSGLPGGWRHDDGQFTYIGWYGFWWSSTDVSATNQAWYASLYKGNETLTWNNFSKKSGLSVRCIRDLP